VLAPLCALGADASCLSRVARRERYDWMRACDVSSQRRLRMSSCCRAAAEDEEDGVGPRVDERALRAVVERASAVELPRCWRAVAPG